MLATPPSAAKSAGVKQDEQAEWIFITGIVGRMAGSGQMKLIELEDWTRETKRVFHAVKNGDSEKRVNPEFEPPFDDEIPY